jgi:hypothetical protein
MTPAAAHARFEAIVAAALVSRDPMAALARARRDTRLPRALRRALAAIDADGIALAAMLVAKLRFERLIRGCPAAEAWFERDPAGMTDMFRRYHEEVEMGAFFPPSEARLFRAWRRQLLRAQASKIDTGRVLALA